MKALPAINHMNNRSIWNSPWPILTMEMKLPHCIMLVLHHGPHLTVCVYNAHP